MRSRIEIAAQTCTAAPSGLVGWRRGENNAIDSSGTGNHGSYSGGFTAARVGQGFDIPFASSQSVRVGDSASPDFTNAYTIEIRVSPSVVGTAGGTSFFACKGSCDAALDQPYSLGFLDTQKVFLTAGNNTTIDRVLSNAALPLSSFTHVAGTYDGMTMRIYINRRFGQFKNHFNRNSCQQQRTF